MAAFALFLFAAISSGSAALADDEPDRQTISPDADFAIYVAKIEKQEYFGSIELDCPEDSYCLPVGEYEITLEPLEVIAGNPEIGTQTYTIGQHTSYRADLIMIIHAARGKDGKWRLIDRGSVALQGCLSTDSRTEADILNDGNSDWFADEKVTGLDLRSELCFERLARPSDFKGP